MLSVYTIEQSEQWDAIVRSFQQHDIYWLSGYVKAFQLHGDGEPLLFYYEDSSCRGINVVMKRDIANGLILDNKLEPKTFFDFSSPYGYGGWLLEGDSSDKVFREYENWCIENGIVSEFVRFHPVLKNHIFSAKSYDTIPLGMTVTLDLTSPEIIWENIISKNRNMIRKAQKNNIKIYNGRFPEIFQEFREIYNSTMNRDSADEYYYFEPNFYESICNDLPHNAQVFYAVLDGKIIAASIMLTENGLMNYHLSGSLREFSSMAPTNLLLYEAALWGCANGCRTLYLGGGVGSEEDSLYKFKKAFYRKDTTNQFFIGKKIFDQKKYDMLVSLRESSSTISNQNFFPKYRAH